MQLSGILPAAVALAGALAAAGPVPGLDRRACQTQMPRSSGYPVSYDITRAPSGSPGAPAHLAFDVPAGAGGPCSLVYRFPAGSPPATSGSNGGDPPVGVRSSATGSLVGSATLVADGAVHTLNSFACAAVMEFDVAVADWAYGEVRFQVPQAGVGFYITYSC